MNRFVGTVVAMVILFAWLVILSGCAKCAPQKKVLTGEAIAGAMAPVICDKYAGCSPPEGFQKEQCIQEVSTGVSGRLKEMQDLKVDQAMLDGCLKALAAASCEALNSPTPPEGCKFLQ